MLTDLLGLFGLLVVLLRAAILCFQTIAVGGITFHSGNSAAVDTLVFEGGCAQTVNLVLGQAGSGSVTVDGAQVSFSGVKSVVDLVSAATATIDFNEGGSTWSVGDAPQADQLRMQSSAGTDLTLADPLSTLSIDFRGAGSAPGPC